VPIKKISFSFDVPLTTLLGLIATGNADMRVDVYGDERAHPLKALNGAHPKLLEGPKRPHGNAGISRPKARGKDASGQRMTAYNAMLRALAKAANHTLTTTDLRPIVTELGLAVSTASTTVHVMRARGHAKHVAEGTYQLTKMGLTETEKRGLIRSRKPAAESAHG
jgi:hypothetical protein